MLNTLGKPKLGSCCFPIISQTRTMSEIQGIPEFYANKTIFVTGGLGFVGKVFIEKILRSCPNVAKIYLLVRSKKGKTPQERIDEVVGMPLFDGLRKDDPKQFSKLEPIEGDVSVLGLGLKETDRQKLIEETDIVYHGAASVRFDDTLKEAILINTRGAREVAYLTLQMKKVQVLVHISTTYCNCDHLQIFEQLYPAHTDWRKTIALVENGDPEVLNVMTNKYISPLPNTYTFAKHLSEHVLNDLLAGQVPIVCCRPSIVVATMDEPFPGWIDNFYGPIGAIAAVAKGILRSGLMTDANVECIPVDMVAKGLLILAWYRVTVDKNNDEMSVYHFSNNGEIKYKISTGMELAERVLWETPMSNGLYFPGGDWTTSPTIHFIKVILYHLIPALFVDAVLIISGQKPMLTRLQRRIYAANNALFYFSVNQWIFENSRSKSLKSWIPQRDVKDFWYNEDMSVEDLERYFRNASLGARKYLLKDPDSTIPSAKKHLFRLYCLYLFNNFMFYAGLFWLVFFKFDILSILAQKYHDMVIYFNE